MQPGPDSPEATAALAFAVQEVERHVAAAGWDGPVRVFALVRTSVALAAEPSLADQMTPDVLEAARTTPWHLTSVEQEGLPQAEDLEELLAGLGWPDTVDGVVVTVERIVLPTAAEDAMPADPDEALRYLMSHPDRSDVRLAVGVLRGGGSWCTARTRAFDADDQVAQGPTMVPGLVDAVRATLQ